MPAFKSKTLKFLEEQCARLSAQEEFILQQIEIMKQQLNSLEVESLHLQRSQKHNKELVEIESVNPVNLDDATEINKSSVDLSANNLFLNHHINLKNESEDESTEEET